jgi:hypothetical protein
LELRIVAHAGYVGAKVIGLEIIRLCGSKTKKERKKGQVR